MTVYINNKYWNQTYRINCCDAEIIHNLAYIVDFGDISEISSSSKELLDIKIVRKKMKYCVLFKEKAIYTYSPIHVIHNIIFHNTVYLETVFPLHGGGVVLNGESYLFLAASQTGKSTLIAYLTKSGFRYINDDIILIDMHSMSVLPYITPMHLRPESLSILNNYSCFFAGKNVTFEGYNRIIYTPDTFADTKVKIKSIFFLERTESKNSCVTLSKDEAILNLMQNLISPQAITPERLMFAMSLAHNCKIIYYSEHLEGLYIRCHIVPFAFFSSLSQGSVSHSVP